MDGYCREFNCEDDSVQVGYFREGKPFGKYQKFDIDENCLEEGIKDEDQELESGPISTYMTQFVVGTGRKDTYRTSKTGTTSPESLKLKQMASYTPTDGFKDNFIVGGIKAIEPWSAGTQKSKSAVVETAPRQRKSIDKNLVNE